MSQWIEDVEVENTPLTTTGGHTWRAAYRLAEYFEAEKSKIGLDAPGVKIIELGAGCGWLGMTMARNLPGASLVCLTEQEQGGACDWLRHNVELNRSKGLPLSSVRVEPCDWLEKRPALAQTQWDFIIGSDLIYNQIGSTCLPKIMAALAGPSTQIYYCHTKHRYDLLDMEFFQELTAAGLDYEEVREADAPALVESPPLQFPPLDLFPEQRIAVFRIRREKGKDVD